MATLRQKADLKLISALILCTGGAAVRCFGGGSGLNLVVIANASSSNSCELANYYCERRQIPPENVLYIDWSGSTNVWSSGDFQTNLLNPLLAMLSARQLTNQIDYVALSMDIPFQTTISGYYNGTTSSLFYGAKPDYGFYWGGLLNSYFATESVFSSNRPTASEGFSFLTTMLTASSLAQAEQLVDQGVASDGTLPLQPVILAKSSDPARNVRYPEFDNAAFNARIHGGAPLLVTNCDSIWGQSNLLGYVTGLAGYALSPATFAPGAFADSMTSFGGVIFGPNGQTSLLTMINAGASGSYGTVAEPSADTSKFPNPQDYFYQARGFNLAESYYQGIQVPYLGLIVGEPLAAPFQRPGLGRWQLSSNLVFSGVSPFAVRFAASDSQHPFQQIDLFVDGKFYQTLTNLTPRTGNLLTVTLNGFQVTYTVSTNTALNSIASDVAALLNANTNNTQVSAVAFGDRVELQSLASNRFNNSYFVPLSVPGASYRAEPLAWPVPPRFISSGVDSYGAFNLHVDTPDSMPYVVQSSTNLLDWQPFATNSVGGPMVIADLAARSCPYRFYRIIGTAPDPRPRLSLLTARTNGPVTVHMDAATPLACGLLASSNLVDWSPIFTNVSGGSSDFLDIVGANRFYRGYVLNPQPGPAITFFTNGITGTVSCEIDSPSRPYVLEVSTNGTNWTPLSTNSSVGSVQTAATSSIGTADVLSTFLTASRPAFLDSQAVGYRQCTISGSLQSGSYLQLTITKTNGGQVMVAVTNQAAGSLTNFAGQLMTLVNTTSALQSPDGVRADDLTLDPLGVAAFNLYSRTPGLVASGITVSLTGGPALAISPPAPSALNQNISDLRARNHLYVTAGATGLGGTFPIDTTQLPDGYHELTAVAYEGSNVRTQTRVTTNIVVMNTPLSAVMTLPDLQDIASVLGTYHIQVTANTNNISTISLYTTGGILNTASNVSSATFVVNGPNLGVGLHPFYALVQTTTGLRYRTQTHSVRLIH